MAIFRCLLCGGEFGCRSSHYCIRKPVESTDLSNIKIILVTSDQDQEIFEEMVDWEYELITNNEYLKNN